MAKAKREESQPVRKPSRFHLNFLNQEQQIAWAAYQQHDVLFLTGPAGTGKTHLAMAFAIFEILQNSKDRIVLTRPIVEAGESLGYLPGDFEEKVNPFMLPLFDVMKKLVGGDIRQKEKIQASLEIAPLAYMRGRAQTLDSSLMTPNGPKMMGAINVGDYVIGSNGHPIKVLGVYPQGKKPIYKINFTDRTSVRCSEDHLWATMTLNEKRHAKGFTVKTTSEIAETVKNRHNQKVHRVPMLSEPVQFEPQPVSVDPYLLGVLLGDGHMRKGAVKLASADEEIISECQQRLPDGMVINHRKGYDYSIVAQSKTKNVLLRQLEELELIGSFSHNKRVPSVYKINSVDVRLDVLRGLMDTDGWICTHRSGSCRIQYCSTSKALADDVMFLVRSLGGYAYSRKREFDAHDDHLHKGRLIRHARPSYQVDIMMHINPFHLSRKAAKFVDNQKFVKLIASVERCGEEECQCIRVDSSDHLYVTDGFNLTHNTFDNAICIFDEAQNATLSQLKLFLSRFGENTKIVITGDPQQSDLREKDVALLDCIRRIETVPGISVIKFKKESIVRHPLVGAILERFED